MDRSAVVQRVAKLLAAAALAEAAFVLAGLAFLAPRLWLPFMATVPIVAAIGLAVLLDRAKLEYEERGHRRTILASPTGTLVAAGIGVIAFALDQPAFMSIAIHSLVGLQMLSFLMARHGQRQLAR